MAVYLCINQIQTGEKELISKVVKICGKFQMWGDLRDVGGHLT